MVALHVRQDGVESERLLAGRAAVELQLAVGAAEALEAEGIRARVVSLPCWEVFEAQDQAYRDEVLPPSVRRRVSVEAGVSLGWERWVGDEGAIIGRANANTAADQIAVLDAALTADPHSLQVREGLRGRIPTLHPGHLGLGGEHPSLSTGDPGVDRSGGDDPGHS